MEKFVGAIFAATLLTMLVAAASMTAVLVKMSFQFIAQ